MSDYEGIKNVPERIWLQVGDDDPESFSGDDFRDLADDGQVTWCADNQFEPDVPYVRADKYKELETADNKDYDHYESFDEGYKAGLEAAAREVITLPVDGQGTIKTHFDEGWECCQIAAEEAIRALKGG